MSEQSPSLAGNEHRYWRFVSLFVQLLVPDSMWPFLSDDAPELLSMESIQRRFILLSHRPGAAVICEHRLDEGLVEV